MKNLAIVLIVVGAAMMIFTGFTLITKKEVVDLGPLEINREKKTPVNWSPIVGTVILVSGIGLLVFSKRSAK